MNVFRWLSMSLLLLSATVNGQTCVDGIDSTTPEDLWVDNGDGTVSDLATGLMWRQCSVGQTWSNGSCLGDPEGLNWQEALAYAHGNQFAGYSDWRLPNLKELSSLTERACVRPAINEDLFPSTPSDDYWSATPSVRSASQAWVVAFFNSSNALKEKQRFVFARLVRQIDPAVAQR